MIKKIILCLSLCFCFVPILVLRAEVSPTVLRYTFNGNESDVSINPTAKKDVILNISIESDRSVKLTRVYFCSEATGVDSCTQDYVKYVSPNTEGSIVTATWDGYKKSDSGPAEPGKYWLRILLKEGDNTSVPINLTDHQIIIGEVVSGDAPTASSSTPTSTTTTTTTETETVQSSGGGSTHSSQSAVSTTEIKLPTVSAGRDRFVLVGAPVSFEAWSKDTDGGSGHFSWSFGDGTLSLGEKVAHAYLFPGVYNVVLNANFNGKEAVSRTKVTVFVPEISISKVDPSLGYVELSNNSTFESNLFDCKLACGDQLFTFPQDTIIDAKSNLKIPLGITKCGTTTPVAWSLIESTGKVLANYQATDVSLNLASNKQELIEKISRDLEWASLELAKIQTRTLTESGSAGVKTEVRKPLVVNEPEVLVTATSSTQISSEAQIGGVIVLDKAPKPNEQSFLSWIKSWFGE